jgi:predicted GNAT family N-acyltransferase
VMHVREIQAEETRDLRHRVLWPHIPSVHDCNIDIDQAPGAIHLGVFFDDKLISIGSLFRQHSEKIKHVSQYRLRAMATDPEYRLHNAGKALILYAIELLKAKQVDALWCDARIGAVGFYSSLGFQLMPEIYEVKNIGPHQFMWFEINHQLS